MRLRFNLKDDHIFRSKLETIKEKVGELTPLYKSWGALTLRWVMRNYREEGALALERVSGRSGALMGGWEELSELTIQSRRRKSAKILQDTGHMKRQWNYRVKAWGVVIGNPSKIAEYHEKGTRGPYEIKPKKRKFLWFGVTPAQRRRGQQLGGYHQWRVKSKPYRPWPRGRAPGIFSKGVEHPGLPARRQLPTEGEIMPELIQTTDKWLEKVISK